MLMSRHHPAQRQHRQAMALHPGGPPPGRSRVDFRLGNGETHVPEHTEVELARARARSTSGVIKLMKGSYREKGGNLPGPRPHRLHPVAAGRQALGHRRAPRLPRREGRPQAGRAGADGERRSRPKGWATARSTSWPPASSTSPWSSRCSRARAAPRGGDRRAACRWTTIPAARVPPPGRRPARGHPRARRRAARARPRARRSWGESPRNVERESRLHLAPLAGRGRGVCAPGEGRPLKNRAPSPFPSPRCAGRGQTIVGLRAVGSKPA